MNETAWKQLLAECVDFARRLIQTPSMSHEESAAAELVAAELRKLGVEDVGIDGIGNVTGRIRGQDPALGALVLNTHLDHVDPGDPQLWSVPPYAGTVLNGRIIGRGACDIKGPMAVQVYSLAAVLRSGRQPRRDIVFSGVVQEEIGGAGARYWVEHLDYPVDLVVLGEPTHNDLALGHRGLVQMWVTFSGRSVHASVPEKGENPNFALAAFIGRVREAAVELSSHPLLGPTSVAPTIIEVDTKSPNVTPAWARVVLDFRTASESSKSLENFATRLAEETGMPFTITDAWCSEPTPLSGSTAPIFGFYTPPESAVVRRARALIAGGMGRQPALTRYQFATDGRHFVPYDIPVIGYSPGEEHLAHTADESIAIAAMAASLRGHLSLLLDY